MLCASSYFERVRDLLPSTETRGCELRLREHPKDGPYVEGKMTIKKHLTSRWLTACSCFNVTLLNSKTALSKHCKLYKRLFTSYVLYMCTYMLSSSLQTQCTELLYTEVGQLMQEGNRRRATASAGMNHVSSQSHAIFTIRFIKVTDPFTLLNGIRLSVCAFVQIAVAAWSYHHPVCIIQWAFSIFCLCWGCLGNDTLKSLGFYYA